MPQPIATPEQVTELTRLISILKVAPDVWHKWLAKSESETFDEMPRDVIEKCITHLTSKLPTYDKDVPQ